MFMLLFFNLSTLCIDAQVRYLNIIFLGHGRTINKMDKKLFLRSKIKALS